MSIMQRLRKFGRYIGFLLVHTFAPGLIAARLQSCKGGRPGWKARIIMEGVMFVESLSIEGNCLSLQFPRYIKDEELRKFLEEKTGLSVEFE